MADQGKVDRAWDVLFEHLRVARTPERDLAWRRDHGTLRQLTEDEACAVAKRFRTGPVRMCRMASQIAAVHVLDQAIRDDARFWARVRLEMGKFTDAPETDGFLSAFLGSRWIPGSKAIDKEVSDWGYADLSPAIIASLHRLRPHLRDEKRGRLDYLLAKLPPPGACTPPMTGMDF